MEAELVDRIVTGVLAQLQRQPASVRPIAGPTATSLSASAASASGTLASAATEVVPPLTKTPAKELHAPSASAPAPGTLSLLIHEAVVTDKVLAERWRPGMAIQFGTKTIITPSARDWLQTRRIPHRRSTGTLAVVGAAPVLLLQHATAASKGAFLEVQRAGNGWRSEFTGTGSEAVATAVRLLATGETPAVGVLTDRPHWLSCEANRHAAVRAVAVTRDSDLPALQAELTPNLFAIDVNKRSSYELRRVLKSLGPLVLAASSSGGPNHAGR